MSASVVSVNVGRVVDTPGSLLGRTGIDNRAMSARVRAHTTGLAGDEVADTKHHGGIDQAVYAYQREDLDRWAEELGRELHDGNFGENLTTRGVDLAAAVIGERWRIGSAEFEVSSPRTPCGTFKNHLDNLRGWVKTFTADGRPGAYLRVLVEGEVGAGDEIVVLHRPDHGVTIAEVFRAIMTEKTLMPGLLDVPELPAKVHDWAREYVGAQPA
ncbi:MOSC domain-containing protein [Sporichthya sp.]|uniref:MOSC domain-containing protein n=1 Tax=Sporichthya sp. TaxID=65475 RepID=UPI0025DB677C|nr:MOSC domain-containing protein [Sporichthya sp.]